MIYIIKNRRGENVEFEYTTGNKVIEHNEKMEKFLSIEIPEVKNDRQIKRG